MTNEETSLITKNINFEVKRTMVASHCVRKSRKFSYICVKQRAREKNIFRSPVSSFHSNICRKMRDYVKKLFSQKLSVLHPYNGVTNRTCELSVFKNDTATLNLRTLLTFT